MRCSSQPSYILYHKSRSNTRLVLFSIPCCHNLPIKTGGMKRIKYYHGSAKPGLTCLIPSSSWYANLSEPTVYLTTNRQLALHYIWDMERIGVKMPMLDIRPDGVLVFQEISEK